MASILRFEPAPRRKAPRGGAHKGSADILFFTGVRYERRPETGEETPPRADNPTSRGKRLSRGPLADATA